MLDNGYFRRRLIAVSKTNGKTKQRITCFKSSNAMQDLIKHLAHKHKMTKSEVIRLALSRLEKGL